MQLWNSCLTTDNLLTIYDYSFTNVSLFDIILTIILGVMKER